MAGDLVLLSPGVALVSGGVTLIAVRRGRAATMAPWSPLLSAGVALVSGRRRVRRGPCCWTRLSLR